MGKVICTKHGGIMGVLSCEHVERGTIQPLQRISFAKYRIDVLGDGTELLDTLICVSCATRFQLSPSEIVPAEVFENENRFPYVAPSCPTCIAEGTSQDSEGH